MNNTSPPDRTLFNKWFEQALQSKMKFMYIVHCNDEPVAYFSLEKISNEEFELSNSGVVSSFTGKGLGTLLVQWSEEIAIKMGAKTLYGWISENNIASYKRFIKLGYEKTSIHDVRHLPLLGGNNTFFKWIKRLS